MIQHWITGKENMCNFDPGPYPLSKWQSGRRNHRTKPTHSKNCGVFCHMTHDDMAFSKVISIDWQPWLFSGNLTFYHVKRDKITPGVLEYFGSRVLGFFARPAILKAQECPGDEIGRCVASQGGET